jgi:hypothetical protein
MLQQMSIVSEYFNEHKEVLLRDNPSRNESWLANEHMRKFIGWLQDQISHSSDTQTSEYLKKLAHGPIFTVMINQGYKINGYMFYTEQQDKKSTYQNSGACVDAYDAMGQDKNMYYGQIQEIWELDFHGFKIPFSIAPGLMESRVLYKTSTSSLVLTLTIKDISQNILCYQNTLLNCSMFQTQQIKDLRWLFLENDESLESRMSSMRKSLINLMRFILSSPR